LHGHSGDARCQQHPGPDRGWRQGTGLEPALQPRQARRVREGDGGFVQLLGDRIAFVGHWESPWPSSVAATLGKGRNENSSSTGTLNTSATRSASSRLGL